MNFHSNKTVQVIDLGKDDYKRVWNYQEEIFKKTVDLKIANRKIETSSSTNTRVGVVIDRCDAWK